ncbi:MAG: cyclic pyranopterin monophosphate synthase MoaC [Pyrinomonadaceae bacterium]|nr:cyclic pyranopterin monophosphate synthase MoaC [Pyrinomonadaceae bacterium]
MAKLSHFGNDGRVKMVDVGDKPLTSRTASATARVLLNSETIDAIRNETNPKGDPLEIARIAGIMGAKKTQELIPLCHQLSLSKVEIEASLDGEGVFLRSTVKTEGQTGVEMEALTAVTIAGLTVYDMCKAVQKDIELTEISLESKSGGKAEYRRSSD